MAHLKVLVFIKNNPECLQHYTAGCVDISDVNGYISDGELFLYDSLCWILPEMSEKKRRETFRKLIEKKLLEAEAQGLIAIYADMDC